MVSSHNWPRPPLGTHVTPFPNWILSLEIHPLLLPACQPIALPLPPHYLGGRDSRPQARSPPRLPPAPSLNPIRLRLPSAPTLSSSPQPRAGWLPHGSSSVASAPSSPSPSSFTKASVTPQRTLFFPPPASTLTISFLIQSSGLCHLASPFTLPGTLP